MRTLLCGLVTAVWLLHAVPPSASAGQKSETCTLSSTRGAYGFSESGSIVGFGPTVNPDCTGTAQLTDSLGRTGTRAFVLVQDGQEFHYLFTDPGFVATGVAKRQ